MEFPELLSVSLSDVPFSDPEDADMSNAVDL
jgi:hypothetical protein